MTHETYTYQAESGCRRYWTWNCPCGATGAAHQLRRDADDEATQHETQAVDNASDNHPVVPTFDRSPERSD